MIDGRTICSSTDGLTHRGANLFLAATRPAFVEMRILDLDGEVIARPVTARSGAGGTPRPPVAGVFSRRPDTIEDRELGEAPRMCGRPVRNRVGGPV